MYCFIVSIINIMKAEQIIFSLMQIQMSIGDLRNTLFEVQGFVKELRNL